MGGRSQQCDDKAALVGGANKTFAKVLFQGGFTLTEVLV